MTLEDGAYEGEPIVPGGAARQRVVLIPELASANVVFLAESSGGTGGNLFLAAVENGGGNAVLLGDRVHVRSVHVKDGRVRVRVLQAGPGDAMCCPGELAIREFAFGPGGLEEAGTEVEGRLSVGAVVGPKWLLVEDEPLKQEVTLEIKDDGSLGGSAGCNKYRGQAEDTIEAPGTIRARLTALTKKMCTPELMEREQRVLRQLEGARAVGFLKGQMTLSYRLADGSTGSMTFKKRK